LENRKKIIGASRFFYKKKRPLLIFCHKKREKTEETENKNLRDDETTTDCTEHTDGYFKTEICGICVRKKNYYTPPTSCAALPTQGG